MVENKITNISNNNSIIINSNTKISTSNSDSESREISLVSELKNYIVKTNAEWNYQLFLESDLLELPIVDRVYHNKILLPGILFTGGLLTESELSIIKSGLSLSNIEGFMDLVKSKLNLIRSVNKDGYIQNLSVYEIPLIGEVSKKLVKKLVKKSEDLEYEEVPKDDRA